MQTNDTPKVETFYPLSPMQQGMLFHTLHAPQAGEYFRRVSCTLEGDLDAALFRTCWDLVLQHHAALRTSFVWEGVKEAVQAVWTRVELPWEECDLSGLGSDEQERTIRELLEDDCQR